MSTRSSSGRVDVAVLGGGVAGCSTAIALARGGASVVVLNRDRRGGSRIGDVLPPPVRPLLEELGVRGHFQSDGHLPSHGNRSLWGGTEAEAYEFLRDPYGVGWHVDRGRFDAMLAREARASGAAWHEGSRVTGSERRGGGWRLEVFGNGCSGQLEASVVVDATGRASSFARSQRVERVASDRLVGVVAWLSPTRRESDQDSLTLIEAVSDGWWYAALLPNGQLVVAFMSDGDVVARGRLHEVGRWLAAVQGTRLVASRLERHGYRPTQGPRAVTAQSSRLAAASGRAWLAVGDSAAAHDPLSSQGMTSALATGVWAARCIGDGTEAALRRYADWVRDVYARYRAHLAAYYQLERRWPASTFWRRRHTML